MRRRRKSSGELIGEEDEFVGRDRGEKWLKSRMESIVVRVSEPECTEAEDLDIRFVGFCESAGVVLESSLEHVLSSLFGFLQLLSIFGQVSTSRRL